MVPIDLGPSFLLVLILGPSIVLVPILGPSILVVLTTECAPFGEVQDSELEFGGGARAVVLRDGRRIVAALPKLQFKGPGFRACVFHAEQSIDFSQYTLYTW